MVLFDNLLAFWYKTDINIIYTNLPRVCLCVLTTWADVIVFAMNRYTIEVIAMRAGAFYCYDVCREYKHDKQYVLRDISTRDVHYHKDSS